MRNRLSRVARFFEQPWEEQRAGFLCLVLLAAARLGVGRGGIPATRRILAQVTPSTTVNAKRLAQIVASASRALPGATTCLPRALVLEALLRAAGRAAELRIGLAPREGKPRPEAHAWVDLGGAAVAEDVSRYTPLPLFGARG